MRLITLILSILFLISCGESSSSESPKDNFKFLEKRYKKLADGTSLSDQKDLQDIASASRALARSLKGSEWSDKCRMQKISYEYKGSFKSLFSIFTNLNLTAKQNDEMFPYWVIDCSEKKNGNGSFRYSIKVHDMFLSDDEITVLNNLSKNDYLNFSANNIASSRANVSKYDFYLALGFSNMPYEAAFCISKSDDEYENELFDCTEEPQFNDKKQITIW